MDKAQFLIVVGELPYDATYSKKLKLILETREDTLEAMANAFSYGYYVGSGQQQLELDGRDISDENE